MNDVNPLDVDPLICELCEKKTVIMDTNSWSSEVRRKCMHCCTNLPGIKPEAVSQCKKCQKNHGMVVWNRITGEETPTDICTDCMVFGTCSPLHNQVVLQELPDEEVEKITKVL